MAEFDAFVMNSTASSSVELMPEEQNDDLGALGLKVCDQRTFERDVLAKVEEIMSDQSKHAPDKKNSTTASSLVLDQIGLLSKKSEISNEFCDSTQVTSSSHEASEEMKIMSDNEEAVLSDSEQSIDSQGSNWSAECSLESEIDSASNEDEVEPNEKLPVPRKVAAVKRKCKTTKKERPIKQSRKIRKNIVDDGDDKAYEKRLKALEKVKLLKKDDDDEEDDDDGSDVEISGGFKVPHKIWNKLYRYQKSGVRWLWELHCQQAGGILADEMGLGKTIQVICFLAGLRYSNLSDMVPGMRRVDGLGPTLIVCPATLLHQWVAEINNWWPTIRVAVLHASGSYSSSKKSLVSKIVSSRGLLITSYSTLLNECDILLRADWHYLILDEGHKIRNPDAKVTLVCKQFRTKHRIILSGSPMQNSLKELWSLIDFIYPGKLGTLPDFMQQFAVPIIQGGYANASDLQVKTAYKCACILRDTISPYLLQRLKADVQVHIELPGKTEQVLFCRLTEYQRELYKEYLDSKECSMIMCGNLMAFPGLITLRKLCNHPDLITTGFKNLPCDEASREEGFEEYGFYKRSGKMVVVEALLKLWKKQNHKVLLFSQGTQMLNILEKFVVKCGYSYLRMDGGTAIGARQAMIQKFNEDADTFVFLLTTKVGGLGTNLTGADRVIIYDPDWNPSTDTQARERAWRIGQTKPVTIYRLLTTGTIEEKILHRQVFKQFLTNRVLKNPKQRRFFKSNDLLELFTLGDDDPKGETETSAIFSGTEANISFKQKSSKDKKRNRFDEMKENREENDDVAAEELKQDDEDESIVRMRNLAKMLSQRITSFKTAESSTAATLKNGESSTAVTLDNAELLVAASLKNGTSSTAATLKKAESSAAATLKKAESSTAATSKYDQSSAASLERKSIRDSRLQHSTNKRRHKKEKKSKKRRKIMVDGEVVANVDRLEYHNKEENKQREEETVREENILNKLLRKSGVHSALQHDKVLESAQADYILAEAEADRVASRAAQALRASRLRCQQQNQIGCPTWTGQHGAVGAPAKKARFGQKSSGSKLTESKIIPVSDKPSSVFDGSSLFESDDKTPSGAVLSSADILNRLKSRSLSTEDQSDFGAALTGQPSCATTELDLITDICHYLKIGAKVNGQATTEEIVKKFKSKISNEHIVNFKFMLRQICTFDNKTGVGIWQLKPEFR